MKMLFFNLIAAVLLAFFCPFNSVHAQINRQAVVQRHKVLVARIDSLSSLSVGNGKFAFTVDATGLQTFPDAYANGVPLGTQSEWGWDTFRNTANYKIEEAYKYYDQYGRKIPYTVQLNEPQRVKEAVNFYRQNVHRLQLGNIGLELTRTDGKAALPADIKQISQQLDPWTGEIKSNFTFEGIPVSVITVGHQDQDIIAASVESALIKQGRLKIRLRFPYATGDWADVGNNWADPERHTSTIINSSDKGAAGKTSA